MGSHVVDSKVGQSCYWLQTSGPSSQHTVFNESMLRPFIPGTFPSQQVPPPPPPTLINNAEEWEVESIKDSQFSHRQLQYLVRWRGYGISEGTWECCKPSLSPWFWGTLPLSRALLSILLCSRPFQTVSARVPLYCSVGFRVVLIFFPFAGWLSTCCAWLHIVPTVDGHGCAMGSLVCVCLALPLGI